MTYERPKNFKIPLSRSIEVLNQDDDVLRKYSRSIFEKEKLKAQVLSHQDPAGTELAYHVAKGGNVLATFEKLKREVMDIHFASLFQKSDMRIAPVMSYECKCDKNESEIKFMTDMHGKVNIVLKLVQQPKSVLYPNKPTGKFIRISIGKKIPPNEKLKESFDQFMNSGGLLIEFIIDTISPVLLKIKQKEKEPYIRKNSRCDNKRKNKRQNPDGPRAFSEKERPPRNFESKNAGFNPHGGPQERHNSRTRGDPIPRRNPQTNMTRGLKPNYARNNSENAPIHSDVRKFVGGSFPSGQRVDLLTLFNRSNVFLSQKHLPQDDRDVKPKRSRSQRGGGRGGGGRAPSGSDGADWRNPIS